MKESKTTSSESPSKELATQNKRPRPPVTLEKIALPRRQEGTDDLFQQEKRDYDREHQRLELREREEDIAHRQEYSSRIYNLVRVWLVAVSCAVALDGINWVEIDASVLVALIGGTTVSVVGLFAIVARYFFPKR